MSSEKAMLYPVTEPTDKPARELIAESGEGIAVQFNPGSLKVSLANALRENERAGSSRAAQYIDKSSSSLSVELMFDTTDQAEGDDGNEIDVRRKTGPIARTFMHSDAVGDESEEPERCLFAWGSFFFVGIMESFEENLEFFSPQGIPLRASVALKLSESRFQYRTEEEREADRNEATVDSNSDSVADANRNAGADEKDWRRTAQLNGVESPRDASDEPLTVPSNKSGRKGGGRDRTASSVGGHIPGAFSSSERSGSRARRGRSGGARPGNTGGGRRSERSSANGVGFD